MAMHLGYRTSKLFVDTSNRKLRLTNSQFEDMWTGGNWGGGLIYDYDRSDLGTSHQRKLTEDDFIDIGCVTDEREELAAGGFAITWIGKGADTRQNINISGKVLRVTISGIIPDGIYVSATNDGFSSTLNADGSLRAFQLGGKSNASVFRYKMNRNFAYANFFASGDLTKHLPNSVQYRRRLILEAYDWTPEDTDLARYVVTGYSISFISGTRNLSYTITLDMAGNAGITGLSRSTLSSPSNGIRPTEFGNL